MAGRKQIGSGGKVTDDDLEAYLAEEAAKLEAMKLLARLDVAKEVADRASAVKAVDRAAAALKRATADIQTARESEQVANEALREKLAPLVESGCPLSLVTARLGVPSFLCRPRSQSSGEEESGAPAPSPIRPESASTAESDSDVLEESGVDWSKTQRSAS
ncbi:MAG: hypothetical protein ACYCST_04450 [Acidimicrobiales bacterium]